MSNEAFIFVCNDGSFNTAAFHALLTTHTPPNQIAFRSDAVLHCIEGLLDLHAKTARRAELPIAVDLLAKTLKSHRALRILRTTADLSLDPLWKDVIALMNSVWYNADVQKTFKSGFFDQHHIGVLLPQLQKFLSPEFTPTMAEAFFCPPHTPTQAQEVALDDTVVHVSSFTLSATDAEGLHLQSPSLVIVPVCLDSYADAFGGRSYLADYIERMAASPATYNIHGDRLLFLLYRDRFDDLLKRFPFKRAFPEFAGPSETDFIGSLLVKTLPRTRAEKGYIVAGLHDFASGSRVAGKVLEVAKSIARPSERVRSVAAVGRTYAYQFKESKKLAVQHGSATLQGRRPQNEDAELLIPKTRVDKRACSAFGIFDGHGGDECSRQAAAIFERELFGGELVRQRMYDEWLRDVFLRTDALLRSGDVGAFDTCGSTAVCAALDGRFLVVGNVGDSECMVVSDNAYTTLTRNHRARDPDERTRILKAGGCVYNGRVYGTLAVSRSLGDKNVKGKSVVIAEPHVAVYEMTKRDRALVLCCDGVYERLSHDDVFDAVLGGIASGSPPATIADQIVQAAYDRGSQDNISAIVVLLRWK